MIKVSSERFEFLSVEKFNSQPNWQLLRQPLVPIGSRRLLADLNCVSLKCLHVSTCKVWISNFEFPKLALPSFCHTEFAVSRFGTCKVLTFQTFKRCTRELRFESFRIETVCTRIDALYCKSEKYHSGKHDDSDALNKLVYVLTSHFAERFKKLKKIQTSICFWSRLSD